MKNAPAVPDAAPHDPHARLCSTDDLLARVRLLVPVAVRRQLWTLFLDADDVQLPMVVPLDGVPEVPDGPAVERWGDALDEVAAEFGVASLVFVLERPGPVGPGGPTASDRDWLSALTGLAAPRRYEVRAVLTCGTDGVELLTGSGPAGVVDAAPTSASASTATSTATASAREDRLGAVRRAQSSPRRLRISDALSVR